MRLLPPEPAPGDKITAELVRELIRCIRERQLLKSADYTVSSGPNGTTIKFKSQTSKKQADGPLPYEVRWDSTLNSGSGGWKIYLPTDHLLSYDNEEVQTSDIDGITIIQDADGQDTPWYSLDDISDSDSNVYLVITISDDSAESSDPPAETTVEFSPTEGQATSGEEVINICIADISYSSGPPVEIEVKQSVVGALYLGKDETIEPDDVSTEFIPEAAPGTTPDGDEGKLQIKGFKACDPESSTTLGADLSNTNSATSSGHVLVRDTSGAIGYKPIGNIVQTQPDDISTEFIPQPEEGEEPTGDEGKLQIKGFKAGQPADTNTIADYIKGATAIPTGGIKIVCRFVDTNGNRYLSYLPLAAIWGDGSSGRLPLPEVTYLDDITWDATNHQLVKHWVKKNIVTGVETPIQGAPQGKTATIATTPISSIIPQSS